MLHRSLKINDLLPRSARHLAGPQDEDEELNSFLNHWRNRSRASRQRWFLISYYHINLRDKLYFRARRSSSPDTKNHYKRFRAHVQKAIRDAYWKHISNIFTLDTEIIDPDSPRKNEKAKKFWLFVKSLKKDAFGITSLRENGILKTDTVEKANICNKQFQSAFTRETDYEIPSKGTSPFTAMGEITVDPKGVLKLLNGLKVHKAPGPDGLSARVLKECSSEIAPILAYIYNESLAQ